MLVLGCRWISSHVLHWLLCDGHGSVASVGPCVSPSLQSIMACHPKCQRGLLPSQPTPQLPPRFASPTYHKRQLRGRPAQVAVMWDVSCLWVFPRSSQGNCPWFVGVWCLSFQADTVLLSARHRDSFWKGLLCMTLKFPSISRVTESVPPLPFESADSEQPGP